ncbi:DNA polymerase III subunit delta' OS=Stutzerimonas stutzeri OX=316 GN=holB PE=4 SV=1 [Stutzerimonas stutzeri]
MNLNAANALLKSLEEPSGETILLLVSHQPSRLLPTIKCCVQQVCPLPSHQQSLEWLASQLPELAAELREELLALAGGSPLLAAKLHGQSVLELRAQVVEGVKKLHKAQQSPASWRKAGMPCRWGCYSTGFANGHT